MPRTKHLITKVREIKGFKMLVEFDGADIRAIDLTRLVTQRPSYRKLKDPSIFKQFHIENGGLTWTRDLKITGPTLYHMGDDWESQNLS